jgi:hypothetical protein
MAIYNYPISVTPNNKVHVGTLAYEIRADVNIKKKLYAADPVSVTGENISIHFIENLNTSEVSALGTLLANHEGEANALVNEFGIPRVVIENKVPIQDDNLKEPDGRINVTPTPVGYGWLTWFTGAGDDPNPTFPNYGRGDGQRIYIEIPDGYDGGEIDIYFNDPIHIHDGQIYWGPTEGNFSVEDYFSVGVKIPPAQVEVAEDGYGNCNLESTGYGFDMLIPGYGFGTHNVDLSDPSKTPPVTVYGLNPNGFWDINEESGVVRPADVPGQGRYNMFNAAMPDVYVIKNVPMGNPLRMFEMDVYKTEYVHQSWSMFLRVQKKSAGSGWVSGWILAFRRNNT